ncbi:PaaI family thioesterase [Marinobacter qingdaonensis]|uniref:PaaI family thioesterase n=1 Tax=Marinobacter qingdaonensis TaxID=3108486 RepID=A0ABU5P2W6_9GAMM|nr:PaaI family thioesterase [Marinobacter sp. ASW11-75]MEA1082312.1 PaaI family thioesterase [Marinobacter sp. ASW11-75]MEE2763982.1 PaaI family thioesterase [Pseudomonadota bacterium]MEE3119072.1 PaaI family thioesterase [Pseudomonadota bacterium]
MNDQIRLDRVVRFLETLNQARELDLSVTEAREGSLTLCLPYSDRIIGNPDTGVIHGGAITTLMDTTSGSVILCALEEFELCPTLDLRVDYMRPAVPHKPVYARAETYKVTRNIIFTRCEAYQEGGETIANCVGTFMRIGKEATPKHYRDRITGGDA